MITAMHLSATFAPTLFKPAWMSEVIAELASASRAGMICVDIGHVYCPDKPMVFAPASRDLERATAATTAA